MLPPETGTIMLELVTHNLKFCASLDNIVQYIIIIHVLSAALRSGIYNRARNRYIAYGLGCTSAFVALLVYKHGNSWTLDRGNQEVPMIEIHFFACVLN